MARQAAAMIALHHKVQDIAALAASALNLQHVHYKDKQSYEDAGSQKCRAQREVAANYLGALEEQDVWLPQRQRHEGDLADLTEAIRHLTLPDEDSVQPCTADGCSDLLRDRFRQRRNDVEILKERAKDVFAGACLDCYKAGGKFEGECRFQHNK